MSYYQDWEITLEGESVCLTPFTEADCEAYYCLEMKHSTCDHETAVRHCHDILNRSDEDEYHVIRLKGHEEMIGWIALQRDPENEPDIGIGLLKEYRNHGYGPEAVKILLNHLHREYQIKDAYAWIKKKNLQSQKAFAKIGAVFMEQSPDEEGLNILRNGSYKDRPEKVDEITLYHYRIPLPVG